MQVAFELRKQHVDTFVGGTVALERGETFDVGAALEEGGGKIVTNSPPIIDRLDNFPALKRCGVPDADAFDVLGATDDALDAYVGSHSAADVVSAAADDPDSAIRLLAAEKRVKGEPRKSVAGPLGDITTPAGSGSGSGDDHAPDPDDQPAA